MGTVAGLGVGLLILAVVWVFGLFVCVAVSRAHGAISYAGVGSIVFAVLLTVVLWFIPRQKVAADTAVIYDHMYVGRTALLTCCCVMLVVGGLLFAASTLFEPRRAGGSLPVKKLNK